MIILIIRMSSIRYQQYCADDYMYYICCHYDCCDDYDGLLPYRVSARSLKLQLRDVLKVYLGCFDCYGC